MLMIWWFSMDVVGSENPAGGEDATQILVDNGVEKTSEVAGIADTFLILRKSPSQLKYSET